MATQIMARTGVPAMSDVVVFELAVNVTLQGNEGSCDSTPHNDWGRPYSLPIPLLCGAPGHCAE